MKLVYSCEIDTANLETLDRAFASMQRLCEELKLLKSHLVDIKQKKQIVSENEQIVATILGRIQKEIK